MADEGLATDLVQAAEAVAALAGDEDRFRGTFDAFVAADRESYQRLLTEFKLLDRCELVCDWICSKYCMFVCLELCGPPIGVELPDLREFAAVVTRITQDEELAERLANTVADRDAEGFRALVAELKIERFCHLLCHWACSVRCRLLCRVVCSPTPTHIASFVEELALAGAAITTLAADERAMAEVTEAVLTGDCDVVRGVVQRLGLFQGCHLVCEWLCTWRCVRVCLLLCRRFPVEAIEDPLGEAFAFAKATARLAASPADLQRLGERGREGRSGDLRGGGRGAAARPVLHSALPVALPAHLPPLLLLCLPAEVSGVLHQDRPVRVRRGLPSRRDRPQDRQPDRRHRADQRQPRLLQDLAPQRRLQPANRRPADGIPIRDDHHRRGRQSLPQRPGSPCSPAPPRPRSSATTS